MNTELSITEKNVLPHTDIERDIEERQNGLFTFTLRINNGQIVDLNVMEYADANKYLALKSVSFIEISIDPKNKS